MARPVKPKREKAMYGTREELCVKLENMFAFDEPLVLLVWTEEGVSVACREARPEPDEAETRAVMKAIGEMKMTEYRQKGVSNLTISNLLNRQRETVNRQVSVPAALLVSVLRNYEYELENRIGMAWEAGRQEPESVREALQNVHALQEVLAA
jgi:hypothetical protein